MSFTAAYGAIIGLLCTTFAFTVVGHLAYQRAVMDDRTRFVWPLLALLAFVLVMIFVRFWPAVRLFDASDVVMMVAAVALVPNAFMAKIIATAADDLGYRSVYAWLGIAFILEHMTAMAFLPK